MFKRMLAAGQQRGQTWEQALRLLLPIEVNELNSLCATHNHRLIYQSSKTLKRYASSHHRHQSSFLGLLRKTICPRRDHPQSCDQKRRDSYALCRLAYEHLQRPTPTGRTHNSALYDFGVSISSCEQRLEESSMLSEQRLSRHVADLVKCIQWR